ncbi:DUF6544 family protein [Desulfoscipio gibsoniae]|uniref:Uncharacterized protein n=1 Tax=Desulfoscipio gibsoniae DSM 7213 TaxID=767817 RepID=R4KP94_9FIRM|nr:DUF6544 family protein [Desulfoscipio gibsoniae]AGL03382.1 hypothetical protein Desgi_4127 [Desulfoscipio gibsoniae DSM 7213]
MPKIALLIIGILAGIIVAILIISHIANIRFYRKAKIEVGEFFAGVKTKGEIIREDDLKDLPPSVRNWLVNSGVVGQERITSARLKQTAVMRMKKENPWMPLVAEQYFTVDRPGYIWIAKVKAAPFVHIAGKDKYYQGRGNMLIRLMSLVTVADGRGKEIDQGSLVRYLAETVWIPTAALADYIMWEAVDEHSARATMSYGGVTASGVFTFNDQGEVASFVAERYGDFDGRYVLETWSIIMRDYRELDGIRVPTKGEVIWKLESGDFNWYQFEVNEIEYNNPAVY